MASMAPVLLPPFELGSLLNHIVCQHHSVIAVNRLHGPRTHGFEVGIVVEVIDPQNRKTPVIGIPPAASCLEEGILKMGRIVVVHDIGCWCVEVTSKEYRRNRIGGLAGKGRCHCIDLTDSLGMVDSVIGPCGALPETEIGVGGSQVKIDHFDVERTRHPNDHLVVASAGQCDLKQDRPTRDDSGCAAAIGVESRLTKKPFGDCANLMGIGVLKENNVRLPSGDVFCR